MIVNLTPHEVAIIDESGAVTDRFPASGETARLGTVELGAQHYEDVSIPVELVEFGHLLKPPPRALGVRYIVSLPAALARPRDDFLVPYREVRDDSGRIIGCRALARPV